MDSEREAFLIQALTDHASRFAGAHAAWDLGPGSAARYTFEGYRAGTDSPLPVLAVVLSTDGERSGPVGNELTEREWFVSLAGVALAESGATKKLTRAGLREVLADFADWAAAGQRSSFGGAWDEYANVVGGDVVAHADTVMRRPVERYILTRPNRYDEPDRWESPNVVRCYSRYARREVRLEIGYVGPQGSCRRVHGGPMEPGPYAFMVPLDTVVDNYGGTAAESRVLIEHGLEFPVKVGDVLIIRDVRFRLIEPEPQRAYPSLAPVPDGE